MLSVERALVRDPCDEIRFPISLQVIRESIDFVPMDSGSEGC